MLEASQQDFVIPLVGALTERVTRRSSAVTQQASVLTCVTGCPPSSSHHYCGHTVREHHGAGQLPSQGWNLLPPSGSQWKRRGRFGCP